MLPLFMYSRILVTLDTSPADRPLVAHITELARVHGSRVVLVHVADGWAARHFDALKLVESEEMKADRDYLESQARLFEAAGIPAEVMLARGEPPDEILKAAEQQGCDLIAMATHGHRFLADLVLGSTIDAVRHRARVPLLVVNA